jgi:secreted trypsin-like serine protease
MQASFLVVVLFFSILSASVSNAIIGGQKLNNTMPLANSIVAIWDSEQEFLCTGTLISESLVLTAAHCMISHPSKLRIAFGTDAFLTLNAREVDVQKEFVRRVVSGRIHEKYILDIVKQPVQDQNDIAILKFAGPMPQGYRPLPVLTDQSVLRPGAEAVIAGYGVTKVTVTEIDPKTYNPKKLAMGIKTGQIECDEAMKECLSIVTTGFNDLFATKVNLKNLTNSEVRTDETKGRSSCTGDSGGPALILKNGIYHVFGIISRGNIACNFEGIYTNATKYLAWITETVQKLEGSAPQTSATVGRRP